MISTFYKDYSEKPTATFLSLDSALSIAKPSVKPVKVYTKQKQDRPIGPTKQTKEWNIGNEVFLSLS